MKNFQRFIVRGVLMASIVALVSCTLPNEGDLVVSERVTPRALSADFSTRKAVAYSGYRDGTSVDNRGHMTDAEILEDLTLLQAEGFGLLRIFSSDSDSQRILAVIRANTLDFKVMMGIWINGPDASYHTANYTNMDEGITVVNEYDDIVVAVSVGNETMVSWSFVGGGVPPADMAVYIKYVRDAVTQPVTTDDNWAFFTGKHDDGTGSYETVKILNEIDFISMHTYPLLDTVYTTFWDWQQLGVTDESLRAAAMMDASITWAKSNFDSVQTYLDTIGYDLPIVIGETGWKSTGADVTKRGHPVNQKMYVDRLVAWNALPKTGKVPQAIFYFEAFDEPWKGGDDNWGLFTNERKAKYVIWNSHEGGYDSATDIALPATPDDAAVYYAAPVTNGVITQNKYVLFSDTIDTTNDAVPTDKRWDAWDGNTAGYPTLTTGGAEGSDFIEITPIPKSWGWGLVVTAIPADNLANFNSATGRLNFSIKTTYAGKIEVGFFTGNTTDKTGCDVYLPIASGEYGYANDGAWHDVSIPISTLVTQEAPAYGMTASIAVLNMEEVSGGFVIADRYSETGNTTSTTKIMIDNIYWSK